MAMINNTFPNEITQQQTPFISFKAFKNNIAFDAINQNNSEIKEYIYSFNTYIPQSLNYSLANTYSDKNRLMNNTEMQTVVDTVAAWGEKTEDNVMAEAFTNAKATFDGAITAGKLYIRNDFFKNSGYAGELNNIAQSYGGFVLNTRSTAVLQEAGRLSLNLDFEYIPQNKTEAEKISSILNQLKNISLVTVNNNNVVNGAVRGGVNILQNNLGLQYLGAPPIWDVSIHTGSGNGRYSNVGNIFGRFNCMNLTNLTITPIGDPNRLDMVLYTDGSPLGWKLNLGFRSMFWQIRDDSVRKDPANQPYGMNTYTGMYPFDATKTP